MVAFLDNLKVELHGLFFKSISNLKLGALITEAEKHLEKQCYDCSLLAQGGYNTIYVLSFTDGSEVVARINASRTGQDDELEDSVIDYRMQSEVSTISFVKTNTNIPVPTICHVVTHRNNPVGVRYILMEKMKGAPANEYWRDLSIEQKESLCRQLAKAQAELLRLQFTELGSLCHESSNIGPFAQACSQPTLLSENRGPFNTVKEYMIAHVRAELALVDDQKRWTHARRFWSRHNGGAESISEDFARSWLTRMDACISALPDHVLDPPNQTFCLFHDDFQLGNWMIDPKNPGNLTGVLDWEGSCIAPEWDTSRLGEFPPEDDDHYHHLTESIIGPF